MRHAVLVRYYLLLRQSNDVKPGKRKRATADENYFKKLLTLSWRFDKIIKLLD